MFLGYEPTWQEIFGTESGDLRGVLRDRIDQCNGVVQIVGICYGTEPSDVDAEFGRISYTQYEASYARKQGKKIWYLLIDESFPVDPCPAEPEELRQLQAAYRRRLQTDAHAQRPYSGPCVMGAVASLSTPRGSARHFDYHRPDSGLPRRDRGGVGADQGVRAEHGVRPQWRLCCFSALEWGCGCFADSARPLAKLANRKKPSLQ